MRIIAEFSGPYRFLSNFWPCTFVWDDLAWASAEHAYQTAKTLVQPQRALIRAAATPGQAKRLGQRCTMRADWDQVKDEVMLQIVRAKFSQNEDLQKQLLATNSALLEEGNWWGDRYWGVCPAGSGDGKNKLGKILMQVREELHG